MFRAEQFKLLHNQNVLGACWVAQSVYDREVLGLIPTDNFTALGLNEKSSTT